MLQFCLHLMLLYACMCMYVCMYVCTVLIKITLPLKRVQFAIGSSLSASTRVSTR